LILWIRAASRRAQHCSGILTHSANKNEAMPCTCDKMPIVWPALVQPKAVGYPVVLSNTAANLLSNDSPKWLEFPKRLGLIDYVQHIERGKSPLIIRMKDEILVSSIITIIHANINIRSKLVKKHFPVDIKRNRNFYSSI